MYTADTLVGMMSKAKLRAELRTKRLALAITEVATKSEQIVAQLQTLLEQGNYRSVHCYEPIVGLHEVDVRPLIKTLQETGVALYTSSLIGGDWRVGAPDGKAVEQTVQFDCIIVPMLGFDRRLHRLGQGGGYYDRLLFEQQGAFKVGVCYEFGKIDELPIEDHDVPLDVIVTESATFWP